MFGRKKKDSMPTGDGAAPLDGQAAGDTLSNSDRTLTNPWNDFHPSKEQVKRATRARFIWTLITSFLLLISVIFLILVEIGNIGDNRVIRDTYFINLDLSNIIPVAVPNAVLINSIARTLGLHDFYRVGLWNFCEGYNGEGITDCSHPTTLWWFNPVEIIRNELLAGASVALPADLTTILDLLRLVSNWMFALFLSGACVNFLMIFLIPLGVFSRWATLPIMIFTFLGALFTTVATVLATALFIIMKNAITSVAQINIGAQLGTQMFVFMWIAASTSIIAWIIQLAQCCCCASRRDVRRGKKRGSKKAWDGEPPAVSEKPASNRNWMGRKKDAA